MESRIKDKPRNIKFLNPVNWESPSKNELISYYESKKDRKGKVSVLMFQNHLSQVDVYCYLKARFGEPNGIINFIKSPTSDNYIHWEYLLKSGNIFINLMGIGRGVQICIEEKVDKSSWRKIVENFREEFSNVGKDKLSVLKSLEEWTEFINRYSELCAEAAIHFDKVQKLENFKFEMPAYPVNKASAINVKKWHQDAKKRTRLFTELKHSSLVLKLLTPVLLEAFINLVILIMCKPEIRKNENIYNARVREELHIKIPSLHITCNHFEKAVDVNSTEYKSFSRIMNDRNWFFHGNADPKKDKLETVYFEKNTPIYKAAGNVHDKYFGALLEMIRPGEILSDYIKAHEFIIYVVNCMSKRAQNEMWQILQATTLGYNEKKERYGVLFNGLLVSGHAPGLENDEELFS